jgi:hypothetical protein
MLQDVKIVERFFHRLGNKGINKGLGFENALSSCQLQENRALADIEALQSQANAQFLELFLNLVIILTIKHYAINI